MPQAMLLDQLLPTRLPRFPRRGSPKKCLVPRVAQSAVFVWTRSTLAKRLRSCIVATGSMEPASQHGYLNTTPVRIVDKAFPASLLAEVEQTVRRHRSPEGDQALVMVWHRVVEPNHPHRNKLHQFPRGLEVRPQCQNRNMATTTTRLPLLRRRLGTMRAASNSRRRLPTALTGNTAINSKATAAATALAATAALPSGYEVSSARTGEVDTDTRGGNGRRGG